jgi:hypothetical protein
LGQLEKENRQKWENSIELRREGRNIEVSGRGPSSEFQSVQEVVMGYELENLDNVERALAVSALGGEPAFLAPR